MRAKFLRLVVLLAAVGIPAQVHAQGYLAPFVGYDVGGDAGSCPSLVHDCSEKKSGYGLTAGFLIGHLVGFEEDLGFAPDFYGKSLSFGSNSVLTAMSNVIVSVPLPLLRPYASAGGGLMHSHLGLGLGNLTAETNDNSVGYDIGGGVMLMLPFHLGLKADVRNMRSLQDVTIAGVSIPNKKLNFSRISIGLLLH
jgi:hypothetical protein